AWDEANASLFRILYFCTKGSAASVVKRFRPRGGAAMGDGASAWFALKDKYQPDDERRRRALFRELNDATMRNNDADPDLFIAKVWSLAEELEDLDEPVSESRVADIILRGLPSSYRDVRVQASLHPDLGVKKIESMIRNMYIDK
ncbi:unnamed protein product, partial [Ectocarpus sp. 4 AP-2014]